MKPADHADANTIRFWRNNKETPMRKSLPFVLGAALVVALSVLIVVYARYAALKDELASTTQDLQTRNRTMITELLGHLPSVHCGGDIQVRRGESLTLKIRISGLSDGDSLTAAPIAHIYKDGEEVMIVRSGSGPDEIRDTARNIVGERLFTWRFSPPANPGRYEVWVEAGTNHMTMVKRDGTKPMVKIGSLTFPLEEIRSAIGMDKIFMGTPVEAFIRRSESLDPVKLIVDVR
jgi:hypothetical protein